MFFSYTERSDVSSTEYNPYINLSGARLKVVPADTENFQVDFGRFAEMLTDKVAAVLIYTPNDFPFNISLY